MEDDRLSPVPLARFKLDLEDPSADTQKRPPRWDETSSVREWQHQYLAAYLDQLPPAERPRRLIAGLVEGAPSAVFGNTEISSRDLIWLEAFSAQVAALPESDQRDLEETFPKTVAELLGAAVAEALARARIEGETTSTAKFATERAKLESEARRMERRLKLTKSRVTYALLFGLLLVGSVAFAVLLVNLLDPQVAEVSIEYNVGEIIAALLGGAGAAAAGIGYAAKALRPGGDDDSRKA